VAKSLILVIDPEYRRAAEMRMHLARHYDGRIDQVVLATSFVGPFSAILNVRPGEEIGFVIIEMRGFSDEAIRGFCARVADLQPGTQNRVVFFVDDDAAVERAREQFPDRRNFLVNGMLSRVSAVAELLGVTTPSTL